MSILHDIISALIALLMSAAFLHFGAASDSRPATPVASTSQSVAASAVSPESPVTDDENDNDAPPPVSARHHHAPHLSARGHTPAAHGAPPVIDAVRAPSPLRHG